MSKRKQPLKEKDAKHLSPTGEDVVSEAPTSIPIARLKFASVRPVFLMSVAAEKYAVDSAAFARLVSGESWIDALTRIPNSVQNGFSIFTPKRDAQKYPQNPSPEKAPIDASYFHHHPSIVFEIGTPPLKETEAFRISDFTIRVFESGAISARCSMLPNANALSGCVEEKIALLRTARRMARDLLYSGLAQFTAHWNSIFEKCQLLVRDRMDPAIFADYYEFIDFDLDAATPLSNAFTGHRNKDYLSDLYAFCSMGKPYARKNTSDETLLDFARHNLGGRNDELWYASSTRFVRSFPNREVSETNAYVEDLLLGMEGLLGLRVSYRSLLEDTRTRIARLAEDFNRFSTDISNITNKTISFQRDICFCAYQLSRCRYPPLIRFYSSAPFSQKVLKAVEDGMQLHALTSALGLELEKMQNVLDSFRTLHSESSNLKLQRSVFRLTVALGIVGSILSVGQIITGVIALRSTQPLQSTNTQPALNQGSNTTNDSATVSTAK
jgi:hypothetical protein